MYAEWLGADDDGSGGGVAAVHRLGSNTLESVLNLFEIYSKGRETSDRSSGVIPLTKG